jgi:hypothetical protein
MSSIICSRVIILLWKDEGECRKWKNCYYINTSFPVESVVLWNGAGIKICSDKGAAEEGINHVDCWCVMRCCCSQFTDFTAAWNSTSNLQGDLFAHSVLLFSKTLG